MDEHDPIWERINQLDRLADQVLGPIDHMHRNCAWIDRHKPEDYTEILLNAAREAARQYLGQKEGIPPHVRSAAQPRLRRWPRLMEGLIGLSVVRFVLKHCSAAVRWNVEVVRHVAAPLINPTIGIVVLGVSLSVGVPVFTHGKIVAAHTIRTAEYIPESNRGIPTIQMTGGLHDLRVATPNVQPGLLSDFSAGLMLDRSACGDSSTTMCPQLDAPFTPSPHIGDPLVQRAIGEGVLAAVDSVPTASASEPGTLSLLSVMVVVGLLLDLRRRGQRP